MSGQSILPINLFLPNVPSIFPFVRYTFLILFVVILELSIFGQATNVLCGIIRDFDKNHASLHERAPSMSNHGAFESGC